ncbi:hypothetical protein [Paenibacillus sp. H1-7]|nr:hypothetical protein [Paenibacillus sp. H1-7]
MIIDSNEIHKSFDIGVPDSERVVVSTTPANKNSCDRGKGSTFEVV